MSRNKSIRMAEFKAAAIDQLKSMIFPLILCAIIGVGIFVIINYQNVKEEEELISLHGYEGDDTPIVMENDKLKFTMDPLTTQFELLVKETGTIWYSTAQGADSDTIAQTSEKDGLNSTLIMSYGQVAGLETIFNSQNYSVKNGLYEIEQGDNSVTVKYSLGDVERTYYIPPVCLESDFDRWIGLMDTNSATMIKQYYKKYDINNLGKKDDKEALLASYPVMETEVIYVLRDTTKKAVRTKMEEIFEGVGYTLEDYAKDAELDESDSAFDKPIFNVDVIYSLDGGDLLVQVPMSSMEYKSEFPMFTITPLPYFGAGGKDEEGFLFVPEGGGALINFNNGKVSQNKYYSSIYGRDMCLSKDAVVHDPKSVFNVFGISKNDQSFLCILEEGVAYASVQADISGKLNNYNYVNSVYNVCVREQYNVGEIANSDIYVYLQDLPDETLTQRYRFINSGSYVDMAKTYRSYLEDKYGNDFEKKTDSQTPVVIEIVCAVDKVKQILGLPISRPFELTTYREAEQIIKDLSGEGMSNMSVKLSGWCNGGVNQKILRKAKTISVLGSKKHLKNMIATAGNLGVDVYLDGVTQYEYDSNIFNGFFSFTDAAKLLTKERAKLHPYSVVTYAAREFADTYYLLHTDLAQEMAENLSKAAKSYGTGISFRETGMDLSADYYRKKTYSRQSVQHLQEEQLKKFSDGGQKIMINAGNDYAAIYADMITNMNLQGYEYTILDGFVPFYQIAIHGHVNYTGESLNISGHTEDELLHSAEYGAGLSFTLMKESTFALQKTLYTEYYGADYDAWHDRMMEIYNRYNAELGHTYNQEITGHQLITNLLSCTTYEDGTKVYVNYDYEEATTPDGVTVPARDYKVVR